MNKLLTILTFLIFIPLAGFAHNGKIPISFTGIVSGESGSAIEGAVISIEQNGQIIQSTQTDEKGQFTIKLEGIGRIDQVKLTVQKKGYKKEIALPFNADTQQLNIQLQRLREPIPLLKNADPNSGFLI